MHVSVLSTGGTIASTDAEGGATPAKSGAELVDAVPSLPDDIEVTVDDVVSQPSYEFDEETLTTIRGRVRTLVRGRETDAIVLTHGTDTMEETAYYLDVTLQPSIPVVLTGAQRRPDEPSPDGPANLLTAVRTARSFADRDASGTYVALDETIHSARYVTKTHTSALSTFASPECGPVADLTREGVRTFREPTSETTHVPASELDSTVAIVPSAIGADGSLLAHAVDSGVDGVVVEATGLGNVTAALAEAIGDALDDGVPVVIASRCLAGDTAPVYGGDGGGATLRDRGVIFAGDLPAHKARLKLVCALSVADDPAEARIAFDD